MPKIKINDTNIYYELHGPENAPVLLLLNGILMITASWAFQTPALSQSYRVLLHDCRGQGQSDHPAAPYTMMQHTKDVISLLDALGIEKAHIAGISYGGEIAQLLGIHYPERVRLLFLSSTVSEIRSKLRRIAEGWIAAAETGDGELLYRCSVTDNFAEPWLTAHPNWDERSIPLYRQLDLPAVLNLSHAFLRVDWTDELHKITAPTMVVVGELDTLKPLAPYARLLIDHIPGAHLLILGGAGHACCIERPIEWNAALLGFLAQNNNE